MLKGVIAALAAAAFIITTVHGQPLKADDPAPVTLTQIVHQISDRLTARYPDGYEQKYFGMSIVQKGAARLLAIRATMSVSLDQASPPKLCPIVYMFSLDDTGDYQAMIDPECLQGLSKTMVRKYDTAVLVFTDSAFQTAFRILGLGPASVAR